MQKLLAEWRKYLAEQTPTKEPKPEAAGDVSDLIGMEDVSVADPKLVKKYERWRERKRRKERAAQRLAAADATRKKEAAIALKQLKSKFGPLAEKARMHVINLLPNTNQENRRRTAALLGKYFNPQLPKKLKLTKKELLVLTDMLGWAQYNQIIKIPIEFLSDAAWRDIGQDAAGVYFPYKNKIFINVGNHLPVKRWHIEFSGNQKRALEKLFSTLTHELWHAVDHTEIRGSGWLAQTAYGAKLPRRKNSAIEKIISKKFPAKWKLSLSWHGFEQHVDPTGFMSVLNRAEMDKLMSVKTHVYRYDKPTSWTGEQQIDWRKVEDWERYCKRGTERYVRFKHLIDAFRQVNHPDSIDVTVDDIWDFCARPNRYYAVHNDLDCLHKGFTPCKKLSKWRQEMKDANYEYSFKWGLDPRQKEKDLKDLNLKDDIIPLNRIAKLYMTARPRGRIIDLPQAIGEPEERGSV